MAEVEELQVFSQDEAVMDTPSEAETGEQMSGVETETDKEGSPAVAKKETVPPKRAPIAARRPGVVTATSGAKTTPTSTTRTTSGGLSKPPARPPAGSAVRKVASGTAAPTSLVSAHRSVPSTSSVDEKKSAALKRTSLAPSLVKESPSRLGAAATGTAAAARKPATATTTSPKTASRPTIPSSSTRSAITNGATTSRSVAAAASKPISAGSATDPKRRVSTMVGPASSRISARPATPTVAASTKEVDELKAKLGDSETRVEELKNELAASQARLLEFGQQLEAEALRVTVAEEHIRTEHHDMVNKLRAQVESQRDESENALSSARESAQKDNADHVAALASITADLTSAKEAYEHASQEKQAEIDDPKINLEGAKTDVQSLTAKLSSVEAENAARLAEFQEKLSAVEAEHTAETDGLKKSLAEEHQAAVAGIIRSHQTEVEVLKADTKSAHEAETRDLTGRHQSALKTLQQQLDDVRGAADAQAKASSTSSESLEAELKSLSEKSKSDKEALADALAEVEALKQKLATVNGDLNESNKQNKELQDKVVSLGEAAGTAETEIVSLKKDLDTLDQESKSMDDVQRKLKADLAAALKNVEDKNKEMSTLNEKHDKELQTISNDYMKEIEALEGNSGYKDKYDEVNKKYEELLKAKEESSKSHAEEMGLLKKDHETTAAALKAKEAELAKVSKSLDDRDAALEDAQSLLHAKEAEHRKALEDLNANNAAHEEALSHVKAAHAKELEETRTKATTAGDADHATQVEKLKAQHAQEIVSLTSQHESARASLTADFEKARSDVGPLVEEIKTLQVAQKKDAAELDELTVALAKEKAEKAEAQAALDAIKNKKPDTSEVDALRNQLQELQDAHQTALRKAEEERAEANKDAETTRQALAKAHADAAAQKATLEQVERTSIADYKHMHDSMTELVEEATAKTAEAAAETTKLEGILAELEANLKVKDAEIAELKVRPLCSP
jgi:chromosome segregation ATPase